MPITSRATSGEIPTVAPPPVATGQKRPAADGERDRRRERLAGRRQHAAERIAAASVQLAAQTSESSAASRLLVEAMQEVAAGAEQSSASCEEILAAMVAVTDRITEQRTATSRGATLAGDIREVLAGSRQELTGLVESVSGAAARQAASVEQISDLEHQADEIVTIVQTVASIADETNLLAINAAIEAARAREHGRGFAVVADEVRALAEVAESSARSVSELIDLVRSGVTQVADAVRSSSETAQGELAKNEAINQGLTDLGARVEEIASSATEVAAQAVQSDRAAIELRRMTEEISAAAEEQAAAVGQTLKIVEQQAAGLTQAEHAAEELSEIAEDLHGSEAGSRSAEEVAAAAEQLSASTEEINRSAVQILQVLQEITAGGEMQAAQTTAAASALTQINDGAVLSKERSVLAVQRADELSERLGEIGEAIDGMVLSIGTASEAAKESVATVITLDEVSRRIDKIVDAISTVALQTNMLAVSGSVESARAGEYGRGFAAVSADIRNLAKESADNSDRIKSLVKDVQDRIAMVRLDLEDTSRLALAEVGRARETTRRLRDVERGVAAIKADTTLSRSAADEIAVAVGQVRLGMDSIASAAAQSERASSQCRDAARAQRESSAEIAEAIEEIASLAEELQSA